MPQNTFGLPEGIDDSTHEKTSGQLPVVGKEVDTLLSSEEERVRSEKIQKLLDSGLWPAKKEINTTHGDAQLENLGYPRFYVGKNADLYIIPGRDPLEILMVRTDRTSVFNIPLDLEIEGKGAIQNQISIQGANFAERHGVKTAMRKLPDDIPADLRDRSQAIELCKQLEIEIGGKTEGMEMIYRNRLTGSLYKKYKEGEDPYQIKLQKGYEEWADIRDDQGRAIFTPTDKTKDDNPIPTHIVENAYPEIINDLRNLFQHYTDFAYQRGYVLVDTKFEVFINSKGEWVLGDEILTPESSRFIRREHFDVGAYISADKQYIRELGKHFGWEKRWEEIRKKEPNTEYLNVASEVTKSDKSFVLKGYNSIRDALRTEFDVQ